MKNKKPIGQWTLEEARDWCKTHICEKCFFYTRDECNINKLTPSLWVLDNRHRCLSASEYNMCKAIGAKYISRDSSHTYVDLWRSKPDRYKSQDGLVFYGESLMSKQTNLGRLDASLFPLIEKGDCIYVETQELIED